jgi:hypothetical protein
MLRKLICAGVVLLQLPGALMAQSAAPDTPDAAAGAEIAAATTDPRFLSPWVSYLPASATVPSPRTFLHRIPGAPGELVNTAAAYAYSRALAAASPRVSSATNSFPQPPRIFLLLRFPVL